MLTDQDLKTLSDKLDERLNAVQKLQAGVQVTNDLLDQLDSTTAALDGKVKDLITKVTDTTRLKSAVDQVTSKNDQLQSLLTKIKIPS